MSKMSAMPVMDSTDFYVKNDLRTMQEHVCDQGICLRNNPPLKNIWSSTRGVISQATEIYDFSKLSKTLFWDVSDFVRNVSDVFNFLKTYFTLIIYYFFRICHQQGGGG